MGFRMPQGELQALLEASPPGARVWLRGLGRSMYPLLRSGDSLWVERCAAPGALRPGDIALLHTEQGLVAHLVRSVEPLQTCSFLGRVDEGPARLLGRVVAIRRGGRRIPMGGALGAPLLLVAHRLAARAARSARLRQGLRGLRQALSSPATRSVRRWWLGPVQVCSLGPRELELVLVFMAEALRRPVAALEPYLRERWGRQVQGVGAFDRRGRLVGLAAREGAWVWWIGVAGQVRRLGVGERLIRALCAEAHEQGLAVLYASVPEAERQVRAFLGRLGFREAAAGPLPLRPSLYPGQAAEAPHLVLMTSTPLHPRFEWVTSMPPVSWRTQ